MKITFIGGGHMTSAIVGGLTGGGFRPGELAVVERHLDKRNTLAAQFGVQTFAELESPPPDKAMVVIAVKPAQVEAVCRRLQNSPLVVSAAAGIGVALLQKWLPAGCGVARVMPNTPCKVGLGMNACFAAPSLTQSQRRTTDDIFQKIGETVWLAEEKLLDAATAVCGSGPAYVYYFIEAMQEAAAKMALPPAVARQMILQTVLGGVQMVRQSGEDAATMRQAVMLKGGTTERAIAVMERGRLKSVVAEAMRACYERAEEIGRSACGDDDGTAE